MAGTPMKSTDKIAITATLSGLIIGIVASFFITPIGGLIVGVITIAVVMKAVTDQKIKDNLVNMNDKK